MTPTGGFPSTTQSGAVIRDSYPVFCAEVQKRLEVGAREYGDGSFRKPDAALVREIEQELLDVMGWGFILWCKVRGLAR
jgi:hypothetical protein